MSQENIDGNYRTLRRNFIVLSIARGMIFWYAIEKLFELRIGFSLSQIVLIGVIAQGTKVIFELPTSVIADRWSRRNILIFAALTLVCSDVILGLSNSVLVYGIGILFWSLSDALTSGVFEAFTYDSLATANLKDKFQKVYTRMSSLEWIVMSIAGISAGVMAHYITLRFSYFLSVVPALVVMVVLSKMQEPKIVRTIDNNVSWLKHLTGALRIINGRVLRWTALIYIALMSLLTIWYEYYQLIGIQVKMPVSLFGFLLAAVCGGMALGAEFAHHQKASKSTLAIVWSVIIATHLLGLRFTNPWLVIINIVLAFIGIQALAIYLEVYIHDNVTSERRATIMSLTTTIAYAVFLLLVVIFAQLLNHFGARAAFTLISLPFVLTGAIDLWRRIPWAPNKVAALDVEHEQHLGR